MLGIQGVSLLYGQISCKSETILKQNVYLNAPKFCFDKDISQENEKMKLQSGKIFVHHTSSKEFLFKKFKELSKLKSKNRNNAALKRRGRYFIIEDIQMANKHIERYLTPSINRKMQNKATMVYYFISIRIANIKYRKKTKELKGTHI